MERRPQRIGRRRHQVGRHVLGQDRHRVVPGDQVVVPIEDHRRIRLVRAQEPVERLIDRGHLGRLERPLGILRRVAGGEQQPVALSQRDLEVLGEAQNHVPARSRPAVLEKAHVTRRDVRLERELELAEAPPPPPGPKQIPDRRARSGRLRESGIDGHAPNVARVLSRRNYL